MQDRFLFRLANSFMHSRFHIYTMAELDDGFFARADEHINLSNGQLKDAKMGEVSASMMFGVPRFNAWVSACGWNNGEEMGKAKEETMKYFLEQYKVMLEENLNDYIENFDEYMKNFKG